VVADVKSKEAKKRKSFMGELREFTNNRDTIVHVIASQKLRTGPEQKLHKKTHH
jgi:hypothetical protein